MMVMAVPLGLMALAAGRDVWLTGDRVVEYGYITEPLVSEIQSWMFCFLVVECGLITIHGLGGKEIYLHHMIWLLGRAFSIILKSLDRRFLGDTLVYRLLNILLPSIPRALHPGAEPLYPLQHLCLTAVPCCSRMTLRSIQGCELRVDPRQARKDGVLMSGRLFRGLCNTLLHLPRLPEHLRSHG